MSVILETKEDRKHQEYALTRYVESLNNPDIGWMNWPKLSGVDYAIFQKSTNSIIGLVEVKVREEPMSQVRSYGGLMLKQRKYEELRNLAELLRVRTLALYGFENGHGDILFATPATIDPASHEPEDPPARRRQRPHARKADSEKVIYLDWDEDLVYSVGPEEAAVVA